MKPIFEFRGRIVTYVIKIRLQRPYSVGKFAYGNFNMFSLYPTIIHLMCPNIIHLAVESLQNTV